MRNSAKLADVISNYGRPSMVLEHYGEAVATVKKRSWVSS